MKEEKIVAVYIGAKNIANIPLNDTPIDELEKTWEGGGYGLFKQDNTAKVTYYCRKGNKFFFRYPYGIITAELNKKDLAKWLSQNIKYGQEFEMNIE